MCFAHNKVEALYAYCARCRGRQRRRTSNWSINNINIFLFYLEFCHWESYFACSQVHVLYSWFFNRSLEDWIKVSWRTNFNLRDGIWFIIHGISNFIDALHRDKWQPSRKMGEVQKSTQELDCLNCTHCNNLGARSSDFSIKHYWYYYCKAQPWVKI